MKKITITLLLLLGLFSTALAQRLDPITWQATVDDNTSESATIRLSAKVEKGWHLYGLDLPADGPNATSISFELPAGVELDGALTPSRAPIEKYDPIFSLKLSWWDTDVAFTQHVKITDGKSHNIPVKIFFQGCNDQTCIAPQRLTLDVTAGTGAAAAEETPADSTDAALTAPAATANVPAARAIDSSGWWEPVDPEKLDPNSADSAALIGSSPW